MAAAIRAVEIGDAGTLARLLSENRAFLEPFEPAREDGYFTESGQADRLAQLDKGRARDAVYPFVIEDDGEPAGTITLSNIVRGALQSGSVGYWVARDRNGRGLATGALGLLVEFAFGPLGLHRLEAGALLTNLASHRVLYANGFTTIGVARRLVKIAGYWQDHLLFQKTAD